MSLQTPRPWWLWPSPAWSGGGWWGQSWRPSSGRLHTGPAGAWPRPRAPTASSATSTAPRGPCRWVSPEGTSGLALRMGMGARGAADVRCKCRCRVHLWDTDAVMGCRCGCGAQRKLWGAGADVGAQAGAAAPGQVMLSSAVPRYPTLLPLPTTSIPPCPRCSWPQACARLSQRLARPWLHCWRTWKPLAPPPPWPRCCRCCMAAPTWTSPPCTARRSQVGARGKGIGVSAGVPTGVAGCHQCCAGFSQTR